MEISVQSLNSLKIRGKQASVVINPQDKTAVYNAAILIGNPTKSSLNLADGVVVIDGPGEYEAGGVKIGGTKVDDKTIYTISIDGVEVLVGDRDSLEKAYQKVKEHNVLLVHANSVGTVSFVSSLGMNALVFFGEHARTVIDTLAKDEKKEVAKYSITADKLPAETETILLT